MEERKIALFLADFDHQVSQIEKIYERVIYLIKKVLKEKKGVLGELGAFKKKVASLLTGDA